MSETPRTPERALSSANRQHTNPREHDLQTHDISPPIVVKKRSLKIKPPVDYTALDFQDPIPQHIRARLPSLKEVEEQRRRDCSDSSMELICEQHLQSRRSKRSSQEVSIELEKKIQGRIDARISLSEVHLRQRNMELKRLVDDQSKLKRSQFVIVRDNLEGQISQIALELVSLHRRKNEIKGRVLDYKLEYRLNKDINNVVNHVMDSMIRTYQILPAGHTDIPVALYKGKRKASLQSNFRHSLINYYEAEYPADVGEKTNDEDKPSTWITGVWCPISKKYYTSNDIRAAHIVPHAIGDISCAYLFGEDISTGHLMNPRNGILIHDLFEQAMDKAQISIVPVNEKDPVSSELMVVVFDRELLKRESSPLFDFDWNSLDGLVLEFKNENRPGLRYLYFNYLLTLLRRRRYQCRGWPSDLNRYKNQYMWGSPGKWLRESSLRAIARSVGHDLDIMSFFGKTDLPFRHDRGDDFENNLLGLEAMIACSKNRSKEFSESEKSESEEEEK